MYLDVSQGLKTPGEEFPFLHKETIPPQEMFGETVTFDEPVLLTGHYIFVGDSLRLEGIFRRPCTPSARFAWLPFAIRFRRRSMKCSRGSIG